MKAVVTAYNGQSITYDAIGNPISYRGMTMNWQGGRQLASVTRGSTALTFAYNEAGLRTSKTVNGSEHAYYWTSGKISAEICDAYSLFFHYDAYGDILGFSYKVGGASTEYYYVKNLQGDVLKVITASGAVVAEYSYDAWGRILTSSGAMAGINPIRYRGYYYDTDLALYYLQSRYYDPEVGRFVNSDTLLVSDSVLGFNLFAYCSNNPVLGIDPNGEWDIGTFLSGAALVVTGVTAVLVAAPIIACASAGAVITAVAAVTAYTGALTVVNGIAELGESVSGYNMVRDGMLGGNAEAYSTYRNITSTVARLGTMICGAYTAARGGNVCFVAGTLVLVELSEKLIENIEPGDKVWAWDEETGQTELKTVVETYENETTELTHVFIAGEEIISTPSHPFYSPVKGWTAACRLRAGDILVTVNGEYVVVEQVQHELLENPVKVYNFQVEDDHTYYVSGTGVLVHNTCVNQTNPGATGQAHHPISNKIQKVASTNPNLASDVTRSGWGTVKATTIGDHFGYQTWHREIDNMVVDWLKNNRQATLDNFVAFMNNVYSSPEMIKRFGIIVFS